MADVQRYIELSASTQSPAEIAEYITCSGASLRDVAVALSVLYTNKVVPPAVIEMELTVATESSGAVTLQPSTAGFLTDIVLSIASNSKYVGLPESVMGVLAGRLISAPRDCRAATYAHALCALCRAAMRPDVIRAACYELLRVASASSSSSSQPQGVEPHTVAALLSSWPAPFAGLSSFPLPGAWVLAAVAAVAEDFMRSDSVLWEKLRAVCVWDIDTSPEGVARLLLFLKDIDFDDDDNDNNDGCSVVVDAAEQWVLCAELMKTHFGKERWRSALKAAVSSTGTQPSFVNKLLSEYI